VRQHAAVDVGDWRRERRSRRVSPKAAGRSFDSASPLMKLCTVNRFSSWWRRPSDSGETRTMSWSFSKRLQPLAAEDETRNFRPMPLHPRGCSSSAGCGFFFKNSRRFIDFLFFVWDRFEPLIHHGGGATPLGSSCGPYPIQRTEHHRRGGRGYHAQTNVMAISDQSHPSQVVSFQLRCLS